MARFSVVVSHLLACALLAAGCASSSQAVKPQAADATAYAGMDCSALYDEADRVRERTARVAYAVDERFGGNIVALGLGTTVFWPALLAMRPDGPDAAELASLKGRDEALRAAMYAKHCPPAGPTLPPERAAALPLAVGERLVYEERARAGGPGRELVLRVAALRRDGMELAVEPVRAAEPDAPAARWQQDRYGNLPRPEQVSGWVSWQRLLQPDMALGSVLSGDLTSPDGTLRGRLRGQVIALGVQNSLGRPFDAAVIELFGDAPLPNGTGSRLSGVMVVDRKSGVLLRLDLSSGNPEFALRRTLVRIDPAAVAAAPR